MNFRTRSLWRRVLLVAALCIRWATTKAQTVPGSEGNGVSSCEEGTRGGTVDQREAGGEGEPAFRWENVAACATCAVDHRGLMVSSQMLGGSDPCD